MMSMPMFRAPACSAAPTTKAAPPLTMTPLRPMRWKNGLKMMVAMPANFK